MICSFEAYQSGIQSLMKKIGWYIPLIYKPCQWRDNSSSDKLKISISRVSPDRASMVGPGNSSTTIVNHVHVIEGRGCLFVLFMRKAAFWTPLGVIVALVMFHEKCLMPGSRDTWSSGWSRIFRSLAGPT